MFKSKCAVFFFFLCGATHKSPWNHIELQHVVALSTRQAREIFMKESNVQPVQCPVTIVGDVHGQL